MSSRWTRSAKEEGHRHPNGTEKRRALLCSPPEGMHSLDVRDSVVGQAGHCEVLEHGTDPRVAAALVEGDPLDGQGL